MIFINKSEQSANGIAHLDNVTTSHEPNPSFQGANVQQNTETNKNNDIKTENIRMNKKLIRLTESDLHRIVKESVNSLLVNGGYISKKIEPYFIAASKDELVSVISTWAKSTTNKEAVVELLECLKQWIHVPNDIWADYNENAWENKYGQYSTALIHSK